MQAQEQFSCSLREHVDKLDFLNWYRFYFIFKAALAARPETVLEIGAGSGIIKSCLLPHVKEYRTMDVNKNLAPDFLQDVREARPELAGKFDLVIIADVLEHIPFADLPRALEAIRSYLKPGGTLLATIPHRRSYFLFMTPNYVPRVAAVPTGFLSFGSFYRRFIKRKIWIDPDHCWEIGDGHIKRGDVENAIDAAGFTARSRKSLLYVDFWIVKKP